LIEEANPFEGILPHPAVEPTTNPQLPAVVKARVVMLQQDGVQALFKQQSRVATDLLLTG
jgi:hypothetical protein